MNIFRKSKNKISWIIPSSSKNPDRQLASVWIRALQVIPYLEKFGFKCTFNRYFPNPEVAIFLRRYSDSDVQLASKLKNKGTKVILDVIVNYFEIYSPHKSGYGGCNKEQHNSFMRLMELSDEIWCASPFLKSIADMHHSNVVFISDSIDQKHFSQQKQYDNAVFKPLRLGWSGVSLKALPLNMFKQWIKNGAVTLCVISDKPPSLEVPYEFRKWSYRTFPKDIIDCDLCIAPRDVNDNYNRGHSLFKIGVFMAEGVPVLASPVPSYSLVLCDEKGGHICQTFKDWDEYLNKCLIDVELLHRWSFQAREMMRPYLTSNISKQIVEQIQTLLGGKLSNERKVII